MTRLKVAVLISGRGSNLRSLIDACAEPGFPAEIVLVLTNNPGAGGLKHAADAGIRSAVVDHRGFTNRADFETAAEAEILSSGAALICLAGFMRLLTTDFVERWRDRLINIHPSLLPAFKGLDTHERALAAGVRISGCTVHFVRADMDDGPIIVQAAVPVLPEDDADALAARVLGAEHKCYPAALRLIAEGRSRVIGNRVEIDAEPAAGALFSPPPF